MRQPIVSVLGHIDHGKTTLLDRIRKTAITKKEAGKITQSIGASRVPMSVIEQISGKLIKKLGIKLQIPGLLFIDTPGHEAFTTLRERGGSIADLAVLVVDIMEGIMDQTRESIQYLQKFKTPFLVALSKIDRIRGWNPRPDKPFSETFESQSTRVQERLEDKVYELTSQLSKHEFTANRFDRIEDFRKELAILPLSGKTGEGVPELLMLLLGLAQRFLRKELKLRKKAGIGSIMEIKELEGIGTTLDVILSNGKARVGDWLVVGGRRPIKTKIRALLEPKPLEETRIGKRFRHVQKVSAATGAKIAAPGLDEAVAGSPIRIVSSKEQVKQAVKEVQSAVKEVQFSKPKEGVALKADTLGSLEALLQIFKDRVPIRSASIGDVDKRDVAEQRSVESDKLRVLFAFRVEVAKEAREAGVKIFQSEVIYKLEEDYAKWLQKLREEEKRKKLRELKRPARLKLLPGYLFRQRKPAIVGVEIEAGALQSGVRLRKLGEKKPIGLVREIQKEEETIKKAKKGQRVAISIAGPTVGRQIELGDRLEVSLSEDDLEKLTKAKDLLSKDERELLEKYK